MGNVVLIRLERGQRAAVMALALAVAGCSQQQQPPPKQASPTAQPSTPTPTPSTPEVPLNTVYVFNGGGLPCVATHAIALLRRHGFNATMADDGIVNTVRTTIAYPSTQDSLAARVHEGIPGARMESTSEVSRVTVTIGQNGGVIFGSDMSNGFYDCPEASPASTTSPPLNG